LHEIFAHLGPVAPTSVKPSVYLPRLFVNPKVNVSHVALP